MFASDLRGLLVCGLLLLAGSRVGVVLFCFDLRYCVWFV